MKIEDGYLVFESKMTPQKKKKITGHTFVDLAGLNTYQKKGDSLLAYLKLYKSDFDKKYEYRGAMAEKMIGFILKKQGKEYLYYDEDYKQKNNFDCFPTFKYCGGIPDFEIPSEKTVHEVKSKSMKDYDKIKNEPPIYEIYQGLYYAYLRKYDYLIMDWVFFDEESENLLFQNKKPNTLDNCKIVQRRYIITDEIRNKIEEMILDDISYIDSCLKSKKIPLAEISPNVLKSLDIETDERKL